MTDPERDEEFEAYLRRRSVLSSHAQFEEKLEPPHDLDDIVLRKARQAIQTPQQLPLYKAPRWALPVTLAATLLLCFSIWLNVSINLHRPSVVSSRPAQGALAQAPPSRASNAKPTGPPPPAEVILPEAEVAVPPSPPKSADARGVPPADARAQSAPTALSMRKSAPPSASGDPEAWLKRIDALRAAGETARADAELSRFRTAFPAYPLPAPRPAPAEPPK
jgi:hypothetical protein